MSPFHLFQMIVYFSAAVFGGIALAVGIVLFCIAFVSEIRDAL